MRTHLELLTRILVHVGSAHDAIQIALGGQGDRSGNLSTGLLGGVDDELGGLIHDLMIIALQADANLLISHFHFLHELKPRLKRCRRLC